jgi:hypothetical protein
MSKYVSDREFTDYVHSVLAIPLIYQAIQWQQMEIPKDILEELDINHGIDYIFKDIHERTLKIQERFREVKYQRYNDFTLRYQRPHNADSSRHQSEFFKIEADYMVYGITNGYKTDLSTVTSFVKYAIIDLKELMIKIDGGEITFSKELNYSEIIDGKFVCPINQNRDYSSNFVAFDIPLLLNYFKEDTIVIKHHGFNIF